MLCAATVLPIRKSVFNVSWRREPLHWILYSTHYCICWLERKINIDSFHIFNLTNESAFSILFYIYLIILQNSHDIWCIPILCVNRLCLNNMIHTSLHTHPHMHVCTNQLIMPVLIWHQWELVKTNLSPIYNLQYFHSRVVARVEEGSSCYPPLPVPHSVFKGNMCKVERNKSGGRGCAHSTETPPTLFTKQPHSQRIATAV